MIPGQPSVDVALQLSLGEVQIVQVLYQQQHNSIEHQCWSGVVDGVLSIEFWSDPHNTGPH